MPERGVHVSRHFLRNAHSRERVAPGRRDGSKEGAFDAVEHCLFPQERVQHRGIRRFRRERIVEHERIGKGIPGRTVEGRVERLPRVGVVDAPRCDPVAASLRHADGCDRVPLGRLHCVALSGYGTALGDIEFADVDDESLRDEPLHVRGEVGGRRRRERVVVLEADPLDCGAVVLQFDRERVSRVGLGAGGLDAVVVVEEEGRGVGCVGGSSSDAADDSVRVRGKNTRCASGTVVMYILPPGSIVCGS